MDTKGSVYLMRHGRTVLDDLHRSDGWLDMPLSDEGRLHLIQSQQALKLVPLKQIVTSTLLRTQETANLIKSGTLSDPPVVADDKARTWNLGIIAGMKKRYGRPEVQKLIDNPDTAPKGGESFNEFYNRFWSWFRLQIDGATVTAPILYVGSGSNLRLIGKMLFGDPDKLDMGEGGLAVLNKKGTSWTCEILVNENDVNSKFKPLS